MLLASIEKSINATKVLMLFSAFEKENEKSRGVNINKFFIY
jgi:hypothetical protein